MIKLGNHLPTHYKQMVFKGNDDKENKVVGVITPENRPTTMKNEGLADIIRPQHSISKGLRITHDSVELPANKFYGQNISFYKKKIIIGENSAVNAIPLSIRGKEVVLKGNNTIGAKITAENNITIGDKCEIQQKLTSLKGSVSIGNGNVLVNGINAEKDIVIGNNTDVFGNVLSKKGDVIIGGDSEINGNTKAKNVKMSDGSGAQSIIADSVTIEGVCSMDDVMTKKLTLIPDEIMIDDEEPSKFIGNIVTEQEMLTLEDVEVEDNNHFKDNSSDKNQILKIKPGTHIGGTITFENGKGTVIVEKGARIQDYNKIKGGELQDMNKGLKLV